MRRSFPFLIVTLAILALLSACRLSVSLAQTNPHAEKKQTGANGKGVWPYFTDKNTNEKVAENLLARNFLLIFDGSGSMSETECAGGKTKAFVAKLAVREWSRSVPDKSNIGLVAFHGRGQWAKSPPTSGDPGQFFKAVSRIQPGGRTPLGDAVKLAYDMLTRQARLQLGYGEYHIVIVTDGKASDPQTLVRWVKEILDNTPIIIHTIGFCIGDKHILNQRGRTIYRTANNPQELRTGLREVLAESETFDTSVFRR